MTSVSQKTVENFGIEVNEKVQWQGWEPGGEYTKQITLKNVKVQTQKIIYKVPNSRFFTTLYPKPVILTCGTSFSLPVTFRPLEKDQYEDKIEFHTKDGNFAVRVKAILPKANLVVPESLLFGMCAIKDTSEISFKLSNPSDVHTSFKWIFDEPFTLSPTTGSLAPKTSCMVKATFSPKAGCVYNATAVCQYESPPDMMEKAIKLEGTGKFPHITVRVPGDMQTTQVSSSGETLLEFGQVPVGSATEKSIYLHNPSPVNALFQVIQPSSITNIDKVFTFSDYHGVVAPESTTKIKVSYCPSCPGSIYVDYFEINVLGAANCSVVKCVGSGKGPRVVLENKSIGFGEIASGGVVTRIINITNVSDVDTVYQFLVDKGNSVFAFETTSGYLAIDTTQSIAVKFRPLLPINYYRKITCLIQNHEPLDLELFGTCHTELIKPAVLQRKHVDQYKTYIERGLSRISPEQLDIMLSEGKIIVDENGRLATPNNTLETTYENLIPEEAFFDDSSVGETAIVTPHISLDHHQISFGKCASIINVQQKTINITNHTKGKVTCNWMEDFENVFTVSPENVDILPLKTSSFTVTFRPNRENQIFGTELECFVSYKTARDYRLVEDKTLAPPWCVTLFCSGETFAKDKESFLPRVEFDTKELVFPAVTLHNTSYRTLVMVNYSPNLVHFSFDRDPTRAFRCKPSQGILKEGLQIIMFRYEAVENNVAKFPLSCCLNNEEKYNHEFFLIGSSEIPKLHLANKGTIYFRPTCVGNVTQRTFKVQNRTRIPVIFEWKAPDNDAEIVQIEPRTGAIFPGECQVHTWSFCPMEENKYLIKWRLVLKVAEGFEEAKNLTPQQPSVVRVVGSGVIGRLNCIDSSINFGKITIGTSLTKQIVLCNPTDCDVSYRLSLLHDVENRHEEPGIELTKHDENVIPARTNTTVEVRAWPRRRATYKTEISYQLASVRDSDTYNMFERSLLYSVTVEGVYPTLTVQDIRATGSGSGYSKVQLWKLLSLEALNNCLDSDPLPPELRYSVATRYSTRRRAPVFTRAVVNFNFGSASEGSEETVIYLSLLNSGAVSADWVFLFPNDLQLELEYWAESGEYTTEELHELQTLGHHLFSIEPKTGVLAPGQAQSVIMKYQHSIVGINRLPILFKIIRGREVLLNFTGVTVEKKQPFVHFIVRHMFTPVPIGLSTPPVQDFILHNGGSVDATYEIDLSPLKALHKNNYDCEIFNCLNPTGKIAPGETALAQWVFAPLEAKTYMVDIPVRIAGCETSTVTFTGIGYDRRVMGDTMSAISDCVTDIPERQIAQVKSQLASLSQEIIYFGRVPLLNKKRRIVFLRNNLTDHIISYRWILEKSPVEKVVEVHPQYGIIKPGLSAVIKVSFFSAGSPSLHEIDVGCEITDHTLMEEYNRKLQKWYRIQEERKHTFTITEKDVAAEKQKKLKKKTTNTVNRLSKSEGDLKKFTALPPIGSAKTRSRPRSSNDDKKDNNTPDFEPPKPFSLHLGVAARTLEVSDVRIERDALTLTSSMIRKHTLRERSNGEEELEKLPSDELRIVTETLSVILRGLLDDENFHSDVKELRNEPIPYFCQFRQQTAKQDQQANEDQLPSEVTHDELSDSRPQGIPTVTVSTSTPRMGSGFGTNEPVEHLSGGIADQDNSSFNNEIRCSAEFASFAEDVFENTLVNLLWEANLGEVNLTSRPRIIALPPSRGKKIQ